MPMGEIVDFVRSNDAYFLLGLSFLSLILIISTFSLSRRVAGLTRRRSAKLATGNVGEIVDCLMDQSDSLLSLQTRLEDTASKLAEQSELMRGCLRKVGVVKFNAFDDVGGDQSFALVLLDADNNGVALSSLYGRQDSRLYVKGITNGEGDRPLSDEEQRALEAALAGPRARAAAGQ